MHNLSGQNIILFYEIIEVDFKAASEFFTSWQTSFKDCTVTLIVAATWCFLTRRYQQVSPQCE